MCERRCVECLNLVEVGGSNHGGVVERRIVRERCGGHVADDLVSHPDDEPSRAGHGTDHRRAESPLRADRLSALELARLDHGDHALLALGHHDLEGLHPGLALRNNTRIDLDAYAAPARHLADRTRETGRAAVAKGHEQLVLKQLEARLDEQLLLERIAHLDTRALVFGALVELLAREHARASDAVAPGSRANEQHQVARAGGDRPGEVLLAHQSDGHRVDEAVALVRLLEVDLAAYRGHPKAVAVAADAGDGALEEVTLPGLVERAEA